MFVAVELGKLSIALYLGLRHRRCDWPQTRGSAAEPSPERALVSFGPS
jgi:hypothetical protein